MQLSTNSFFLTFLLIIIFDLVLASIASAVDSRVANLERTFQCAPSVRFTMTTLRINAEHARAQHKSNVFSVRAEKSEFPKGFQSPIYGCDGRLSCVQWPIPHDITSNTVRSPFRLIMSDIMTPLGVVIAISVLNRVHTNIQTPNNIIERYLECRTLPTDGISQDRVD